MSAREQLPALKISSITSSNASSPYDRKFLSNAYLDEINVFEVGDQCEENFYPKNDQNNLQRGNNSILIKPLKSHH